MPPGTMTGEGLNAAFLGRPESLLPPTALEVTGPALDQPATAEMQGPALASPASEAAGQVYAIPHGEQVYKGTVEEAMQKCPVIGRMAIAEAQKNMERVDLMARMKQRGRERREAEEAAQANAKAQQTEQVLVTQSAPAAKKTAPVERHSAAAEPAKVAPVLAKQPDTIQSAAEATQWSQTVVHNLINPSQTLQQEAGAKTAPAEQKSVLHGKAPSSKPSKHARIAKPVASLKPKPAKSVAATHAGVAPEQPAAPKIEAKKAPVEVERRHDTRPVAVERDNIVQLPPMMEQATIIAPEVTATTLQAPEVALPAEPYMQPEVFPEVFTAAEFEPLLAAPLMPEMAQPLVTVEPAILPALTFEPKEPLSIGTANEAITNLLASPIPAVELPAPAREVAAAIDVLAATLEHADEATSTGEPSRATQLVHEIVMLTASSEAGAAAAPDEAVDEKLNALFEELFEQVGVEYTQQLVVSFVTLARAHRLQVAAANQQMGQDATPDLPDEVGTREFLQGLRHLISSVTGAARHFYGIGVAALQLYGFRLTLLPPLRTIDTFTT